MMRAPVRPAISRARAVSRGWSANVCLAANISCWKRASTAGESGSTHFNSGDAMDRISRPAPRTISMARASSSSPRSTMFLPNTMRSSAPVMPMSVMERTAISMSGENSSVMAATGKCAGMNAHYKARQCENSKDAKYRFFGGNGAALPHPGTGRDRHDDGRRSRPVPGCEIAMTMDGVLRLYFGESNLPTPEYIKQAANRALADGYTFYTENAGWPPLRRALADNYRRLHGVALDPAGEIVVTASGVQALNLGIRCVLDPGDEAIVLTPAWPNGPSSIMMANATVRQVPHPLVGGRYTVDFEALEAAVTPRTRLLLYTSPSNPL